MKISKDFLVPPVLLAVIVAILAFEGVQLARTVACSAHGGVAVRSPFLRVVQCAKVMRRMP